MGGAVRIPISVARAGKINEAFSVTLGTREEHNPYTAELAAIAHGLNYVPEMKNRVIVIISPNVLQSRDELSQLQYPPPTTEPIPCLAPPKLDVLKCRHCSFEIRQVQAMHEHCAKSHDWANPRSKGRPPIGHPAADPLPWIEGVACQRFFTSREGSKWFQLSIQTEGQTDRSKVKQSAKKPQVTLKNPTSKASAHLQQVIGREARYREALSQPRATVNDAGTDTFAATSLWLAVYRQLAARRSYHTYIPRWVWVTDDVSRIKRRSY
ncbi:hypothetical protein FOQG_17086 [Fusarium oxysporum f. sp. raphani 54005]|uniref:C2H2-type domain-containing protein n=1 Tax=Fusarium oxysporum f. sp. raphani 54005 TaxID=1089458 RepID=X0BHC4_FUSOX|nr:hypothetical protein FOQG_17086 [Fusarium oxysporum f. sp. raphani 54005]